MKKTFTIIILIITLIALFFIVVRNIPFKESYFYAIYDFDKPVENVTGKVTLSAPALSFGYDESYQDETQIIKFYNLSSKKIVKKEIEKHLETYEIIKCNNQEYFYNKKEGYTIVKYEIKTTFPYNTISYEFVFGNYCTN